MHDDHVFSVLTFLPPSFPLSLPPSQLMVDQELDNKQKAQKLEVLIPTLNNLGAARLKLEKHEDACVVARTVRSPPSLAPFLPLFFGALSHPSLPPSLPPSFPSSLAGLPPHRRAGKTWAREPRAARDAGAGGDGRAGREGGGERGRKGSVS